MSTRTERINAIISKMEDADSEEELLRLMKEKYNLEAEVKSDCEIEGRIKEAEYWRDQIFSPSSQSSRPTISLTDFVLRIEELKAKL